MMTDRGDKIIHLAHELLRSDMKIPASPQQGGMDLSFKILCLSTCLAAFGGSAVTAWSMASLRPIDNYERVELDALIYYTVKLNGGSEDDLRNEIERKLDVHNLSNLNHAEFQAAQNMLRSRAAR